MPTTIKLKNNVTSGDDFSTITPGNLADGEVVVDTVNGKLGFKNRAGNALHEISTSGGGATALGDLTDVDDSGATNTQVLTYINGQWEPGANDVSGTVSSGQPDALAFYQSSGTTLTATTLSKVRLNNGQELAFGTPGAGVEFQDGGKFTSFITSGGVGDNSLHITIDDADNTPQQNYIDFEDTTTATSWPCIRIEKDNEEVGVISKPAIQLGDGNLKLFTALKTGVIACDKVDGTLSFKAGNTSGNGVTTIATMGSGELGAANMACTNLSVADISPASGAKVDVTGDLDVSGDITTGTASSTGISSLSSSSLTINKSEDPSLLLLCDSAKKCHVYWHEGSVGSEFGINGTYDGNSNSLIFSIEGTASHGAERFVITRDDYTILKIGDGVTAQVGKAVKAYNGAYLSTGGSWENSSSREYKEEIVPLEESVALETFMALEPVTFRYKNTEDEHHVGFIAEDVPELVASARRDSVGSMDVVGVLTKVMQKQEKEIDGLKEEIEELKNLIQNLGVN